MFKKGEIVEFKSNGQKLQTSIIKVACSLFPKMKPEYAIRFVTNEERYEIFKDLTYYSSELFMSILELINDKEPPSSGWHERVEKP